MRGRAQHGGGRRALPGRQEGKVGAGTKGTCVHLSRRRATGRRQQQTSVIAGDNGGTAHPATRNPARSLHRPQCAKRGRAAPSRDGGDGHAGRRQNPVSNISRNITCREGPPNVHGGVCEVWVLRAPPLSQRVCYAAQNLCSCRSDGSRSRATGLMSKRREPLHTERWGARTCSRRHRTLPRRGHVPPSA